MANLNLEEHVQTQRAILDTLTQVMAVLTLVPGTNVTEAQTSLDACRTRVEKLEADQAIQR